MSVGDAVSPSEKSTRIAVVVLLAARHNASWMLQVSGASPRKALKPVRDMRNPNADTQSRVLLGTHPANQHGSRAKYFRKKFNRYSLIFQLPSFDHA
jgi:hypothetical protein